MSVRASATAGQSSAYPWLRAFCRFRLIRRRLSGVRFGTPGWSSAAGALLVVAISVPFAVTLNIWIDEAFTLHTTGAGPLYAWRQAAAFEAQPPLYFVLEAAWRTWDEGSIAFARLPSIGFAAAAVAAMVGMTHRIAPRVPPPAVALTTALNPIVLWAAVEMRVYALVLLIGVVLSWSFFEGYLVAQPSRPARIWYAVFAIAGLYTQYYVGFVLIAHLVTLLALRRGHARSFAGMLTIAAVAFAPLLATAREHVAGSGDMIAHVSLARTAREIADAVFVFILPHDQGWASATKFAGLGLVAALVVTLALGRPALPAQRQRGVVVAWLACLAIFTTLFAICGVPLDPVRHLIVLAPPSLLVALLCLTSVTRRRAFAGALGAVTFSIFALAQLWGQYQPPAAKRGDWQRVAAVISAGEASTPIAVFPAELALPLGAYLRPAVIAIPTPMPFTIDYVAATTLGDITQVSRRLDSVRAHSERLWLITSGDCATSNDAGYGYGCEFLEHYLERHYRLLRASSFRGSLVRLYTRRAAPLASALTRRPTHATGFAAHARVKALA